MNWFVARLVYRIIVDEGKHIAQFDEQLKLFSAVDDKIAFEKALKNGFEGQDQFPNNSGGEVQWKFVGISELTKMGGLQDGTELTSKILEVDDAENHTAFILQKNHDIESRLIPLKSTLIA